MSTIGGRGGQSTGSGTDHHSGWREILSGETVTIAARKQMVVFIELINDGTLEVEGDLIIED